MRVFSRHCHPDAFLTGKESPGDYPALRISLQFKLRTKTLAPPMPVLGLLDTGACITLIPGYYLGLSKPPVGFSPPPTVPGAPPAPAVVQGGLAAQMDPESVEVWGVGGYRKIPAYWAEVKIGNCTLPNKILVGAMVGKWSPLIGRDVLDQFLLTVDPGRRTSALAGHPSRKVYSFLLNKFRGQCLTKHPA